MLYPYNASAAVAYAHRWAYGRNPAFYDYENIGGDCTNFASQCLFAGSGRMNYTPTFGWYYISANEKSPSWTGVEYLYNFLTRKNTYVGPAAQEVGIEDIRPGDLVQLSFDGVSWQHTPIVVAVGGRGERGQIYVAAHSYDADNRPLASYEYRAIRFLHVIGYYG